MDQEPASPTEAAAQPVANHVGVKFQEAASVFRFDAGAISLRNGDTVVVSTEHGQRLGTVTELPKALRGEPQASVRRIVRKAESHDLDKHDRLRLRERDALRQCLLRIRERNLQMKLIKAEQPHESGKILFYFSAENRIDFRDLVRELAHVLHARIEMKQIGSRDEAKVIGAAGPCGRELCCSTWLREPGGVSVKMAKAQGLSLNPSKLAGMCGRLKCCLRYEYDTYLELGRALPNVGKRVESVKGEGVVLRHNTLKQTVLLQLAGEAGIVEASLEDLVQKKAE
ncbi:MAG TPA: regulatory iron-sulfur-containing complex subunit RicT [Candidatus Acidoferrales bacterium]|nr:regulatory iron-sulfur-containing complex subunit RicT [Candidatus Acidoferrales bacterium]